ncbi:MAG: hypothetical protein WCG25_10130 [bacterium]
MKKVDHISINFCCTSIINQQTKHLYLQIAGIFSLALNFDQVSNELIFKEFGYKYIICNLNMKIVQCYFFKTKITP